jgi:hypothetical protein
LIRVIGLESEFDVRDRFHMDVTPSQYSNAPRSARGTVYEPIQTIQGDTKGIMRGERDGRLDFGMPGGRGGETVNRVNRRRGERNIVVELVGEPGADGGKGLAQVK